MLISSSLISNFVLDLRNLYPTWAYMKVFSLVLVLTINMYYYIISCVVFNEQFSFLSHFDSNHGFVASHVVLFILRFGFSHLCTLNSEKQFRGLISISFLNLFMFMFLLIQILHLDSDAVVFSMNCLVAHFRAAPGWLQKDKMDLFGPV